jgi:hypothetical protein
LKKLFSSSLAVLAVMFVLSCFSNSARAAQLTRAWVSGTGDDASTSCSRTAPCKTFAAAIATTIAGGQINCLDAAGFGALSINKSITIDCHEAFASILVNGTSGITINFDAFTDNLKMVNLRNLNIEGLGGSGTGIIITGDGTGSVVSIEGGFINHFAGGGIVDGRTNGALSVSNTSVRNNTGTGISMASATGRAGFLSEALTNVNVDNSNYGIIAGPGVSLFIGHSVITNNASAGVYVSGTSINMHSSLIMHNGTGIDNTAGVIVRLSDNDFISNGTAGQGNSQSYGTNRFFLNGLSGTISPTGNPNNYTGEQ